MDNLEEAIEVVDIGANPIDSMPPYISLLKNNMCRIIGFEPQKEALEHLNKIKSAMETYLPYVVGDGKKHILNICSSSGMTSLFAPDPLTLDVFPGFRDWGTIVSKEEVETQRLDDIKEVEKIDFLKIDVQGSELMIFENGRKKLSDALVIQTEISLTPLYKNQPLFSDIDKELRNLGFLPHFFETLNKRYIKPLSFKVYPEPKHLLEADIVYVKDFRKMENFSDKQLLKLFRISHYCYKSYELAFRALKELIARKAVKSEESFNYLNQLQAEEPQAKSSWFV